MKQAGMDRRTSASLASLALCAVLVAVTPLGCRAGTPSPDAADGGTLDDGAPPPPAVEAGPPPDASARDAGPSTVLSATQIDLGAVACGTAGAASTITAYNTGAAPVSLSATVSGGGFAVSPAVLRLDVGAAGTFTLTTSVPTSAVAGAAITGSLVIASDAPGQAPVTLPLSVTPTGAVLAFAPGEQSTFAFPLTEVGHLAELPLALVNAGNAPAAFTLESPSDPHFTLVGDGGAVLAPGDTLTVRAGFLATDTTAVYGTSTVDVVGVTCGPSLRSLTYSGRGGTGQIVGWPATVDFGLADCGGAAPAGRSFTLTNPGAADVHITQVTLEGPSGFTTSAQVGRAVFANGGTLVIRVSAPAVPTPSSSALLSATLTIQTDAEAAAHAITLTEQPNGAILAFDTSGSPGFGDFGQVPVLGAAGQAFNVVNTGSTPAQVTLVASPGSAFSVSVPDFALAGGASQVETATFAPTTGGSAAGSLSLTATGALCGPLPAPIPLSGTSGAVPEVSPAALTFGAVCGGAAPGAQVFVVTNAGDSDMTWSLGDRTGPGAGRYSLAADPPPGTLIPGAKALVAVTAASMPSPAPSTDPATFAAQVVITTDVPFDPPHVVTFGENPLGDQLSFVTASPLRFGQVPVGTALGQAFVVANRASAGSDAATLSFVVQGEGAAAYSVTSTTVWGLAAGGVTSGESLVFAPAATGAHPASLAIVTSDFVCTPLPAPLALSGGGT